MAAIRPRASSLLRLVCAAAALPAAPAAAGGADDLFGPESVSVFLDARLVAAHGEPSWTDGGFGKTRFDGEAGETRIRPIPAEAQLVWQPRLMWDLAGTVTIAAQHEQDEPIDLIEAYLTYKPVPRNATRISARAGLFWPPVSLEHEGATWTVPDMVTPSAINSWVGEEVKVVGLEATLARELGGARLSATAALFGGNDTAGTLLAFRGWALHDLKAGAFGHQRLPELNDFMKMAQAPATKPLIELDGRPGWYGKLSLQAGAPLLVEALYYDNRGDPEAVTPRLQWGWDTRFLSLGARAQLAAKTRLTVQALSGTTEMGPEDAAERYWVETRFRSAYLKLSQTAGPLVLSARSELFDTRERGAMLSGEESEDGWAVTGDASWRMSQAVQLLVEGLRVSSDRGVRRRTGLAPHQSQTVGQIAVRVRL